MKPFVCTFSLILFVISAPAVTAVQLSQSVIGTGGWTLVGGNNMLLGTLGQPLIGLASGPTTIHEIGFWTVADYSTSTEDDGNTAPSFCFPQNHPNPFNPVTTLEFTLPEDGRITLRLYDVAGRVTRLLVDDEMKAGRHSLEIEGEGLASGIYFCRIHAGRYTETRKLVLVK